jgi:hypothetical protein
MSEPRQALRTALAALFERGRCPRNRDGEVSEGAAQAPSDEAAWVSTSWSFTGAMHE